MDEPVDEWLDHSVEGAWVPELLPGVELPDMQEKPDLHFMWVRSKLLLF